MARGTSNISDGYTSNKESDRKTYATLAWLGYGVGAACLATGAILYLLGSRSDGDGTVALLPSFAPGQAGAVVQADDGRSYVVKFRGAAQGVRVLLAELVAGELARAFGLPVPELVLADVSADLGRAEPHPEIRAQLLASAGRNLGMAFLSGALGYDARPAAISSTSWKPSNAAGCVWRRLRKSNSAWPTSSHRSSYRSSPAAIRTFRVR